MRQESRATGSEATKETGPNAVYLFGGGHPLKLVTAVQARP